MSDSKYSPPVNIPEAVPERAESIFCLFFPATQHIACSLSQLMLKQLEPGVVALGFVPEKDKFAPLATFKGNFSPLATPEGAAADKPEERILLAEKKIVVP